jgi:hypothetical protein
MRGGLRIFTLYPIIPIEVAVLILFAHISILFTFWANRDRYDYLCTGWVVLTIAG